MVSLIEFALFAWVGISVVAVLVQLVRIARYKRNAGSSAPPAAKRATAASSETIDLGQRLGAPAAETAAEGATASAVSTAAASGAATTSGAAATSAAQTAPPAAPQKPVAPVINVRPPESTSNVTPSPAPTPSPAAEPEAAAPASAAEPSPAADPANADLTLADLLAGVRLPWNLLPTVDQGREPSNDRVVLMTNEGEPGDIGVDVADELERLGFEITPRGDDVAIATRGEHALGLQIIPEPANATVDGVERFPSATADSVALDIWIE